MVKENPPKISENELQELEKTTIEKVNHTISAIEVALSSWDAAKTKPKGLEKKIEKIAKFYQKISAWERKVLMASKPTFEREATLQRLYAYVRICDEYWEGV